MRRGYPVLLLVGGMSMGTIQGDDIAQRMISSIYGYITIMINGDNRDYHRLS